MSDGRRSIYFAAACSALVVFSVYVLTLFPGPHLWDSSELTAVAWNLGISHPPGQPLYMLVAWVWMHLLPGDPAYLANLLSAFFGAAACFVTVIIACAVVSGSGRIGLVASAACSAAFFVSRPVWWQASRAEVYTLNMFLVALFLLFGFRLLSGVGKRRRNVVAMGLLTGLVAANHTLTAVVMIPAFIAAVSMCCGRKRDFVLKAVLGLVGFLAPLVLYLYIPIRDDAPVFVGWQCIDGVRDFLHYVSGVDFSRNFASLSPVWLIGNARNLMMAYIGAHGPIAFFLEFFLVLFGCFELTGRLRKFFLFIVVLYVGVLASRLPLVPEFANPDLYGYLVPLSILNAVLASAGVVRVWGFVRSVAWIVVVLIVAFELCMGPMWDSSEKDLGWRVFRGMLTGLPRRAVVYVSNFHLINFSWYAQGVAHMRPDVTFVFLGMVGAPWYVERLGFKTREAEKFIKAYPFSLEELAGYRPVFIEPGNVASAVPRIHVCKKPYYFLFEIGKCSVEGISPFKQWPGASQLARADKVTRQFFLWDLHQILLFKDRFSFDSNFYEKLMKDYYPLLATVGNR